jgi:hypothetical protein
VVGPAEEAICHCVVYDVNVYLDVAELLGPPFTWDKFHDTAAQHRDTPVPHSDSRVDSLRALALATTGRFAGPEMLQVWTSTHIDGLVAIKAEQSTAGETAETRGLGWDHDAAEDLVDHLVWTLVYDRSSGGACDEISIPYGCPPLSHEDGLVYRTAERCGQENSIRYLVTNDRAFRNAELPGDITLFYPREWVNFVRASRFAASAPRKRPPTA